MERQRGLLGRMQSRFWEGHCPEPFPRVGSTEPWSQPPDVRGPEATLSSKLHTGDSPLPPGRPRRGCSCPGCPDPNPHPEPSVSQQPGPQQLLLPPLLLQPESAWEDRALGQSLNPVSEGKCLTRNSSPFLEKQRGTPTPTQAFGWAAVRTFTPALVHCARTPRPCSERTSFPRLAAWPPGLRPPPHGTPRTHSALARTSQALTLDPGPDVLQNSEGFRFSGGDMLPFPLVCDIPARSGPAPCTRHSDTPSGRA